MVWGVVCWNHLFCSFWSLQKTELRQQGDNAIYGRLWGSLLAGGAAVVGSGARSCRGEGRMFRQPPVFEDSREWSVTYGCLAGPCVLNIQHEKPYALVDLGQ